MSAKTEAEAPENLETESATDDPEPSITLDETLNIQNVGELYERLKKAFSAFDSLEINASQVVSVDTAALQLLAALKKEASKQQKTVMIIEPSARLMESAELLDLLDILELGAEV